MATDRETEISGRFGRLVREQRRKAGLRQEDIALAAGVGRRFIVELEAGKPTCQLGKALRVAEAVGVQFPQLEPAQLLDLPDCIEDDDDDAEDDGEGLRLHEYTRECHELCVSGPAHAVSDTQASKRCKHPLCTAVRLP